MKLKSTMSLLLAGFFVLSPMSVFAASENSLSKSATSVMGKSVFMQDGWGGTTKNLETNAANTNDIEYLVTAPEIIIKPTQGDIRKGNVFKLSLENAEWFFRHSSGNLQTINSTQASALASLINGVDGFENYAFTITQVNATTKAVERYSLMPSKTGDLRHLSAEAFREIIELTGDPKSINILNGQDADVITCLTALSPTYEVGYVVDAREHTGDIGFAALATEIGRAAPFAGNTTGANLPVYNDKFTDSKLLTEMHNSLSTNFKGAAMEVSTYDPTKGVYFPNSRVYIPVGSSNLDYYMTITPGDNATATVGILTDIGPSYPDKTLTIPLVSRSFAEGDVRVRVAADSNQTVISSQTIQYGMTTKGATSAMVETQIKAKYNFPLDKLIIKENVPGSLRKGTFYIEAPYGFTFEDLGGVSAMTGESLFMAGNATSMSNSSTRFIEYGKEIVGTQTITRKDILVIDTNALGLISTTQTNGVLTLVGLTLVADDGAAEGDIKLKIYDHATAGSRAGVSEQEFTVGTKSDWKVTLTSSGAPTLINGKYSNTGSGAEYDKFHKTGRVTFAEEISSSWWSLRETEFILNEEAKFRKVEILTEENIKGIKGVYHPGETKNNITVTGNKIRMVDLSVDKNKAAKIEMDLWVSVELGYEGDITLSADGDEILRNTPAVKIAAAKSPITITSSVTDLKIGYQWQKVADVEIRETEAGLLERNKRVDIFIDDEITGSDNISFAPDFTTSINSESKMNITTPVVRGSNISFTIDRMSNGTPAVIKFENLSVKIDRTVPETNKKPYLVVAGGNAIAGNFSAFYNVHDPYFSVEGIGTGLINVITSADGATESGFTNVVWVKIGSREVTLGRDTKETITMDTEAYISAVSDSTMVPVRFVTQALGMNDNQLVWDDANRTVTIINGAQVIQFKAGSSSISINGVTTNMYNEAQKLVYTEIKDDRSFLPFRKLGDALNIKVAWDEANRTAIYNFDKLPQEEQDRINGVTPATTPATTTANTTTSADGNTTFTMPATPQS